jgi:VCBS repeat-containing protein
MPVDYTGNTLSDARHLSISTSIQSHIESVGFTDTNDYYRVQLSGRSSLSLAVTGLSANANVQLLNSQGNLIQDSSNPGSLAETINQVLNAGTYYIRVFSVDNIDTNYQLSVVAGSRSNDLAGNTLATALNIGLLNASGRYSDSVGGADSNDYYRLSLNYAGSIALSLNSLSGNADLQLLNTSGSVLQTSGNGGSTLDWINRTLAPGIYYVRVNAGAGSSTANYSLSATVHATPILDLNGVHVSGNHASASFTEGFGAVSIVDPQRLTLSDVDSSHLTQAIVTITNLQDGVAESLAVDTSGTHIQTSYNSVTGELRLGGTDTVANYQKVLRSIVYNNTSQNPNLVPRNISFTVTDGTTFSTVATASVAITPSNGAPNISTIANQVTDEDVPTGAIAFSIDDIDTPLSLLTLSATSSNSTLIHPNNIVFGGSGANRTVILTPNANQSGNAKISIVVNDGAATTIQTFDLTVNPVNDAPIAFDNSYNASEDVPLNVNLAGILNNDLDVDGDPLSAMLVSNPSHGNLTLNSDGTFLYTPNANFNGTDRFTYRAFDGSTHSNVATVTITVNPVNDAPVALDNLYNIDEDSTLTIPVNGVLGNDSDIDEDVLSASLVSNPAHGTLTLNSNGAFVYTPNANFNGTDSFTYRAFDGVAYSNLATVTITVNPVNDAPIVVSDAYSVDEDGSLTVLATGVLGNDRDLEVDPLSANLVTSTTNGTLSFSSNGAFVYTPNANFFGTDTFTYRAFDGVAYSNPTTVSITVNPIDDLFIAVNDTYSVDEDGVLTLTGLGVLTNDINLDNDPLTAILVSNPTSGTLSWNSNGTFTYTPNANFNGTDSFTYRVFDGTANSNSATVNLIINPVNDAPVLDTSGSPTFSTIRQNQFNTAGNSVRSLVMSSITDIDIQTQTEIIQGIAIVGADTSNGVWQYSTNGGQSWTNFGAVSVPSALVLTTALANTIRFVPAANFIGTATISFRAWDATNGSANGAFGVNTSLNGGMTAFSTAIETAMITVRRGG